MKDLNKLIILNNIRRVDSTHMKLMIISTYFYVISLIIMCAIIIFNFSQLYKQYGGITSQNCIITVLYSSFECWSIEFMSYINYDRYKFHMILWYSIKSFNPMNKGYQYLNICDKQFFDTIIITNIEIFGIILSELSISTNKSSQFSYMINAIIIVLILLLSLWVLIRKIKFQFYKGIIELQQKGYLHTNVLHIKDEINKVDRKIHINNIKIFKIKNEPIKQLKSVLGAKEFNNLTDNMF